MKTRKGQSGKATSMVRGLAAGTAASMLATILFALIISKLLDSEAIQWENTGYTILGSILTAAFSGSWTAFRKIKHQRLLVCMTAGLIYWSMLLCIGALCYGGNYGNITVTGLLVFAGSMTAFLVTVPRKKMNRSRGYRSMAR